MQHLGPRMCTASPSVMPQHQHLPLPLPPLPLLLMLPGYAVLLAPHQTSLQHDMATALSLGYANAVTFVLMSLLGVMPLMLAALMLPSLASAGKVGGG